MPCFSPEKKIHAKRKEEKSVHVLCFYKIWQHDFKQKT